MTNSPQIKICGLTRVDQAIKCAELGADAIGFIFYPKSPRNLSREKAKEITAALSLSITTVGVFVNETFSEIMRIVETCNLTAVQLHGREKPDLVSRLSKQGITVIKVLFDGGSPSMDDAFNYNTSAFLVECAKGNLPGGNAMTWNWKNAYSFGKKNRLILAGGLAPENVAEAINAAKPDAVDVSSGVEAEPGIKDLGKVEKFIKTVATCNIDGKNFKNIFRRKPQ